MQPERTFERIIPSLLFADGLIAIAFAFLAHTLGIDPTPDWGRLRILSCIAGVLFCGISLLLFKNKTGVTKAKKTSVFFLVIHIWAIIILIYTWFVTFGTFTEWRASTRYYSLLATAFGNGNLYVDVAPGAELLAAEDPYNSEGRPPFEDDVWDLSLYKEKLYLYWGPVPALLMMPIQLALKTTLSDMYPVFFFLCGVLIFNSLILLKVWQLFFAEIPIRYITASIFVVGLILPIPWSLSLPDVYEAAIGAGQFFLMGGIYFIILAFENNIQKRHLFLAGFFWACSVGSRAINVLPILFLVAVTSLWLWKYSTRPRRELISRLIALLAPLALGATLIGWYNWARFDSPLEFGLRYQITIYNLNRDMPITFQPEYIPYNVLAYVLLPFEFVKEFPFIVPMGLSSMLQNHGLTAPKLYAAGNVTGMLFFAPFLLFAFTPFFKKKPNIEKHPLQLQNLTLYLLGGSFLISFISLLLYYYGQLRFMVDVVSQITLLAIFGYWASILKMRSSKLYLFIANLLVAATLIISVLLVVTSESGRMQKLNPSLFESLNNLQSQQK